MAIVPIRDEPAPASLSDREFLIRLFAAQTAVLHPYPDANLQEFLAKLDRYFRTALTGSAADAPAGAEPPQPSAAPGHGTSEGPR